MCWAVLLLAFGLLALTSAAGLRAAGDAVPWLDVDPRWTLAGVLALAGGFQFSKLERSCLTNCRDPRAFLYQRYADVPAAAGIWAFATACPAWAAAGP